jgi:AcrR family transcriptional regulator
MPKDDIIRADILRAAEALFQKWGLKKTTMEDIAKAAGKGKSTLYYYYRDKSEILYAVIGEQLGRILKNAEAAVDKQTTAKGKLFAYTATTFKEIRDALTLFDILRGELKINDEFIDKFRKRYDDFDENKLREILEYGFKRKEFKTTSARNIDSIVRALANIKRSLLINVFVENDDEELIALVMDLMYHGL